MYSPTTRLLTILEVLQSQSEINGPDLAARLEVEVRSVRRYVTMLRDMGVPIESLPGRYGSYYLSPGFRLPPMMFTNSEILSVVLGLLAARHLRLSDPPSVESALSKIARVLPEELQGRMKAMQAMLSFNLTAAQSAPDDMLTQMSLAAYHHRQLWIEYAGHKQFETERVVDVYGLVYHGGNWYAVGHCHLRNELRSFRLDRVVQTRLLEETFDPPPPDFDPLAYLLTKIASMTGTWMVEALLNISLEEAKKRVPRDLALLHEVKGGVLLRTRADDLHWAARFLVRLDCPLQILRPTELRDEMGRLAISILHMTRAPA